MKLQRLFAAMTGMSMVEVAAALTVSAVAAGAAAPAIQDYVTQARYTRAQQDVHTIAIAVARLESDVMGQSTRDRGWATFDLLVGPGAVPAAGQGGDSAWLVPAGSAKVGVLDDHLVTNTAGYTTHPPRQNTPIRGWHGPYIESGIPSDPWGNRYAVNSAALANGTSCTVVVSAGPNGVIETAFAGASITPGGDDVLALVGGVR